MLQTKYRLVLHLIGWEDGKIFFLDQSQGEAEYKPTMLLTLVEHWSKKSREAWTFEDGRRQNWLHVK